MKILRKIAIIPLILALLLVACERENKDVIYANNPGYAPDTVDINPYLKQMNTFSSDTIFVSCVRIPFPVDFKQASGNVLTVNSDLRAALNLADSVVDFVCPLSAVVNSSSRVIQGIQDFALAIVSCDT